MKLSSILLTLAFSTALCATAFAGKPPEAVLQAFQKHFPAIKKAHWDKEGNNYEAEFDLNGAETSATFTAAGQLLETESEIPVAQLPQPVRDYLQKNHPGKKIKEAAKITDAAGAVTYEAEVKSQGDLLFDAGGKLVEKKK